MASPLKLSIKASFDISEFTTGAQAVKAGIEGLGNSAGKAATQIGQLEPSRTAIEAVGTAANTAAANVGKLAPASSSLSAISASANQAGASMQKLVAAQAGFANASAGTRDKAADIAAYGRELDNLRARFNPLYAAISRYKATIMEIQSAHKVGAISTAEMTAAISRERQATLSSIDAIKGRNAAIRATPAMPANASNRMAGNNNFQTANIAAQFQDIGVTAAMGMSPMQIALQQGTQLSAVIGSMANPIRGLGAAFMSVINPVSLLTIGIVGAAAAAYQWLSSSKTDLKTYDDAVKAHKETLDSLKGVYGELSKSAGDFTLGGKSIADSSLRANASVIRTVTRQEYGTMMSTLTGNDGLAAYAGFGSADMSSLTKMSGPLGDFKSSVDSLLDGIRSGKPDMEAFDASVEKTFETLLKTAENPEALRSTADAVKTLADSTLGVGSKFNDFAAPINKLKLELAEGRPNLVAFQNAVEDIGLKSGGGFQETADKVILLGKNLIDLNGKLLELEQIQRRLFNDRGANGLLLSRGATNTGDMGNFSAMMTAEKIRLDRERKAFVESQKAELAITPDQKQAAAQSVAAAQYDNDESPVARRQRIELAGLKALATAEAEVSRAQRERIGSLSKIVEARRDELAMIGKSSAEQERLQFQTRALADLKIASSRDGLSREQIDDETLLIQKQAEEVGKLNAQIAAKKILSDQAGELQKLEQERSLIGASTEERIRATSAMEAEQQIRDRGIGLLDKEAAGIRDNAKAIAEKRIELGRLAAAETLSRQRAAFDATQQSALARSPQEKAAAARAVASAQVSPGEDPAVRAQRIELAGKQALLQAEQQLSQAREERARSLQASIDQQAFEVSIVGKSAAEQERLRTEYRLTAEVRAEAARNGTVADEKEIELIRQKTAELARLKAEAGAQTLLKDQATELQKLELERQLIGATAQERARAMAAMEAEQQIREHGIDAMSREAQAIRDNAARIADAKLQVEQMSAAWNEAQQAGMTAIDKLTAGIGDLNADWKSIAKDALGGILDTFKELSIANPLKNAIYGTNLPTTTSMGGVGGFFGALVGQKPTLPGASPITSTGSMNVTAASVSINGTAVGSGGLLGALTGNNATVPSNGASAVAANGLAAAAAASPVTGAAGDVQSTAWNYFAAKGLPPHQIAGILGNMKAESAFNPQAVGDNGHALGLFQWNDRAPAMLNSIGGRQNLGDVNKQLDFAWQEMQTSENPAFQRLRASTDVRSATAAFAGFERPMGYSLANPEGAHNFSGRYAGAEQAMAKFSTNTNTAATSLNTLDSGVTDTAKALTSGSGSLTQSASALATQTQALPQQTEGLFSSMTSSLSKGIGSLTSGIGGLFSNLLGGLFADGAAFSGGNVIAFAGGGVVTSPTPFPMAGGRVGLMGEAGAEAIMPLKRGRDGKLGVTMAYPQQAAGRRDESRRGPQPIHMTFDSNVVVSGNGDKELMDRMHIAVDEKVKRWGESFSQSVLPRRINEIRSDPYAVG